MIYAPPGSGYCQPEDEPEFFGGPNYSPTMEYPGTLRPGRTRENIPFEDLPIGDDDPDPVPWPHFQEIQFYHRWDAPHPHPKPVNEMIYDEGRWATPEEEAEMMRDARRGVRKMREMAEAEKKAFVVVDDEEDDDEEGGVVEEEAELVMRQTGVSDMLGKKVSKRADVEDAIDVISELGVEADTKEETVEEDEDDDADDFLLDLGLDEDDEDDDGDVPATGEEGEDGDFSIMDAMAGLMDALEGAGDEDEDGAVPGAGDAGDDDDIDLTLSLGVDDDEVMEDEEEEVVDDYSDSDIDIVDDPNDIDAFRDDEESYDDTDNY